MILHPAQAKILSDTHRFRVLVCGRKFGKTTLAGEEIKACAFSKSGRRVLYIAPTLEDARRLMWERLKSEFKGAEAKTNDTRLELIIPTQDDGQSTILLGSWEKVDNYRGDEFDLEVYDEVQDYRNFWIGWQESMRPTLTPRQGSALFMGTPKGYNHFYDLHNFELKSANYKSFKFTTYDNPFISKDEIEEAHQTLTPERFSQEYMADFTKTEGLVYREFKREQHVYSEVDPVFKEVIAGVDLGFQNPACALGIGISHTDTYYVKEEFYKIHKTDADVAEYVAGKLYDKVYPDPESASGVEEMKRRGVNVKEVIKGKDSVKNGIDRVRELFKSNKLYIHSSCINLINELETYSYPEKKDMRNEDENPIKEHDHAVDALRYALMMHSHAENNNELITYIPLYD